jgi:hypothetical protein
MSPSESLYAADPSGDLSIPKAPGSRRQRAGIRRRGPGIIRDG